MPLRKGQVDCKVPSLDIVLCQRKSNIHSSQEKFLTWAFDSTNKDEASLQLCTKENEARIIKHLLLKPSTFLPGERWDNS